MADVTFEQEVQEWIAFCKKDGKGALPVSRAEVEKHMRTRFVSVATGQAISQEELDLIFDYTCDACEAYISTELIGKHGWGLDMCEAFLTGKLQEGNKIRYCSETVKTSLLNLQFASRFDSMSRPKSQGVPNLAHLTLSSSPKSSTIRPPSGHGPFLSAGTSILHTHSTPPSTQNIGTPPNATPLAHENGTHKHTHSSPASVSVSISPSSLPSSPPHATQSQALPAIPPRAHLGPPETRHSAPILPAHQPVQSHQSPTQLASSVPTILKGNQGDSIGARTATNPIISTSHPPISSASTSSLPDITKASSSSRKLVDGHVKRQPCPKIGVQGYCSPRDCLDSHPPAHTICKWLTSSGSCDSHGCPFQHPNVLTRETILGPIFSGSATQRALSTLEWDTLRVTMVFYCPIPMKEKKCSKGGDCKRINCPKQHKRAPKETTSLGSHSKSVSSASLSGASPSSSSSSLSSISSSSTSSMASNSSSKVGPGNVAGSGRSTSMTHAQGQGMQGGGAYALGVNGQQAAPPLPPKPALKLKDVTLQANHMSLVTSIMQGGCAKSAKPLKIVRLEEISNAALDDQYRTYFQETQASKGGLRPSELYAFHGAPASAIQAIASKGFDMSKIKRTKFGHGLYCALDANVSVDYCGDGNKMLLVRLITDGLKWVKDPAYYVIQDAASMNPLYIITFEK